MNILKPTLLSRLQEQAPYALGFITGIIVTQLYKTSQNTRLAVLLASPAIMPDIYHYLEKDMGIDSHSIDSFSAGAVCGAMTSYIPR